MTGTEEQAAVSASSLDVGASLDVYTEFSTLGGRRVIDAAEFDESFDYSAGPWAVRGWGWLPWTDKARLGAAAVYRSYTASRGNGDYVFGPLLEAYAQIDYELPGFKKFEFGVEGRGGFSVLFPSGDFGREIERLEADGINVFGGPRVGWQVGAAARTRYPLHDHFRAVANLGFDVGRIYLFHTKQTVDDVNLDRRWTNQIQRLTLSLGIEVLLK